MRKRQVEHERRNRSDVTLRVGKSERRLQVYLLYVAWLRCCASSMSVDLLVFRTPSASPSSTALRRSVRYSMDSTE